MFILNLKSGIYCIPALQLSILKQESGHTVERIIVNLIVILSQAVLEAD